MVIIGGGRMGEAICAGLLASGTVASSSIIVADPDAARRGVIERSLGIRCVPDGADVVGIASLIILAVKPQVIEEVVRRSVPSIPPDAVVVSIAAGVTISRLESLLPAGAAVVRVMPNTAVLAREGMSVVSAGSAASPAQVEAVRELFAALGSAITLDEAHQDAATAISGSGPAYVALFVDALAAAGEEHGLDRGTALTLAVQTIRGTAGLLAAGSAPGDLIAGVSSPGGTTVAALASLESDGFGETVGRAVAAAVRRAKELGA